MLDLMAAASQFKPLLHSGIIRVTAHSVHQAYATNQAQHKPEVFWVKQVSIYLPVLQDAMLVKYQYHYT